MSAAAVGPAMSAAAVGPAMSAAAVGPAMSAAGAGLRNDGDAANAPGTGEAPQVPRVSIGVAASSSGGASQAEADPGAAGADPGAAGADPGAAGADPGAAGEALESLLVQLGTFGLYQRYVLLMLCLPNLLAACYSLNYVFVAGEVPFRCLVPECESPATAQFSDPRVPPLLPALPCRRYAPLNGSAAPAAPAADSCPRDLFHPEELAECDQLVYESNTETIFAEFDLGCRPWLRTLVGSVRNAALPVALVLTGYVSDVWGRRSALCVFSALAGLLGLAKSLAAGYRAFLALEFLEAALGYGFNSAGYVLLLESAAPELRGLYACASGAAYGLGGMLLAAAAWRLRGWRLMLRALHAPALLLPLYARLLHESARWLAARGRGDEAARDLRAAARWNKVRLDEAPLKTLQGAAAARPGPGQWRALLRSRALLLRLLLCGWLWAAAALVYYGLTVNSVSLSASRHAGFALNMAMEVAASLLLAMSLERLGRRRTVLAAFLLCAAACLGPYFAETRAGHGMFFVGKLGATCAFNALYVFTAELFPTGARGSALAACSLLGRAGAVLAPQTPLLGLRTQALVYSATALSAALLVLAAPETARRALPADVGRAERLRHAAPKPRAPPPGVAAPPAGTGTMAVPVAGIGTLPPGRVTLL